MIFKKEIKYQFILTLAVLSICILLNGCQSENSPNSSKLIEDSPNGDKEGVRSTQNLNTGYIYDYNIIIAPDLSNRINTKLYPKPIHDSILLNGFIDQIPSWLNLKNRKLNQKDVFKVDLINQGVLNKNVVNARHLEIRFDEFVDMNSFNDYFKHKLHEDIVNFKNSLEDAYDYSLKNPSGADVWNYFNQTIHKSLKDTVA